MLESNLRKVLRELKMLKGAYDDFRPACARSQKKAAKRSHKVVTMLKSSLAGYSSALRPRRRVTHRRFASEPQMPGHFTFSAPDKSAPL